MPAVILRLLTLVALVLMPFGMGAAIAGPVHHSPAAASAGHCDEPVGEPAEPSRDGAMDCLVSCSMVALAEVQIDEPTPALHVPAARPLAERGAGLHPDPATPPPKHS